MAEVSERFSKLDQSLQATAIATLRTISENVYVYVLQSILQRDDLFEGQLSGQLASSTIRAFLRLCSSLGRESECAAGPLGPDAVEVLSKALRAR